MIEADLDVLREMRLCFQVDPVNLEWEGAYLDLLHNRTSAPKNSRLHYMASRRYY